MRPEEESATLSFVSRFKTEPVTREIVDGAAIFYGLSPNHSNIVTIYDIGSPGRSTGSIWRRPLGSDME